MKILIIEDDIELTDWISEALEQEKYLCEQAFDFNQAWEKVNLYAYDLYIIDINLPKGSGLDVIKTIKSKHLKSGIIIISARNALEHKIEGLDLGADDYITKPFDMAELIARVKSLIRRQHFSGCSVLHCGGMKIDTNTRTISIQNKPVSFTKSEYDILLFFCSNPQRILTRESIAEHIWGDNMDLADSFDFIYSHIKNIRKKITDFSFANPILSVYGIGYKLNTDEYEINS
jgi:DNA-binding response OmpR family regulator